MAAIECRKAEGVHHTISIEGRMNMVLVYVQCDAMKGSFQAGAGVLPLGNTSEKFGGNGSA